MFKIASDLSSLLCELTAYLEQSNQDITFYIIGAFALELKGIKRPVMTVDIDLIREVENEELAQQINRIGERIGNESWMNLDAISIQLPDGISDRLELVEYNHRIKFRIPCREDMILLKVAAYCSRIRDSIKDKADLEALQVTRDEFEKGVSFYKKTIADLRGTPFEKECLENIEIARSSLGL